MFDFLNVGIGWLLGVIFKVTNHYALSIILLTVIIKFAILPLSIAQLRSSRGLSQIQPQLQELQKKYKNDKETLNQKTIELYKEHKVNPLQGCLPILIQMPILFALFAVLKDPLIYVFANNQELANIANNQVFLWIKDFSQPDKLSSIINTTWAAAVPGILPFLAAILTYLQFETMPTTTSTDNEMANNMNKNMKIMMPIMILFFGNGMSAGLSLYWVVSTLFQMIQQIVLKPKSIKEAT